MRLLSGFLLIILVASLVDVSRATTTTTTSKEAELPSSSKNKNLRGSSRNLLKKLPTTPPNVDLFDILQTSSTCDGFRPQPVPFKSCLFANFQCEAGFVRVANNCGCGCLPVPPPAADAASIGATTIASACQGFVPIPFTLERCIQVPFRCDTGFVKLASPICGCGCFPTATAASASTETTTTTSSSTSTQEASSIVSGPTITTVVNPIVSDTAPAGGGGGDNSTTCLGQPFIPQPFSSASCFQESFLCPTGYSKIASSVCGCGCAPIPAAQDVSSIPDGPVKAVLPVTTTTVGSAILPAPMGVETSVSVQVSPATPGTIPMTPAPAPVVEDSAATPRPTVDPAAPVVNFTATVSFSSPSATDGSQLNSDLELIGLNILSSQLTVSPTTGQFMTVTVVFVMTNDPNGVQQKINDILASLAASIQGTDVSDADIFPSKPNTTTTGTGEASVIVVVDTPPSDAEPEPSVDPAPPADAVVDTTPAGNDGEPEDLDVLPDPETPSDQVDTPDSTTPDMMDTTDAVDTTTTPPPPTTTVSCLGFQPVPFSLTRCSQVPFRCSVGFVRVANTECGCGCLPITSLTGGVTQDAATGVLQTAPNNPITTGPPPQLDTSPSKITTIPQVLDGSANGGGDVTDTPSGDVASCVGFQSTPFDLDRCMKVPFLCPNGTTKRASVRCGCGCLSTGGAVQVATNNINVDGGAAADASTVTRPNIFNFPPAGGTGALRGFTFTSPNSGDAETPADASVITSTSLDPCAGFIRQGFISLERCPQVPIRCPTGMIKVASQVCGCGCQRP